MSKTWDSFGYRRIVALQPKIQLGNPEANADILIQAFKQATQHEQASLVMTPELALTGYTCEDLFHSDDLIKKIERSLEKIRGASVKESLWVVGTPLRLADGRLFNVAMVFHQQKILGAVPKQYLPNMGEFYERRWFMSGMDVDLDLNHSTLGTFRLSPRMIFSFQGLSVGIEICHDLWAPQAPSTLLALQGANLILNLSASNETLLKESYRKKLVEVQSSKLQCAYLYSSAGTYESSKDTVFSGHALYAECGKILNEIKPFEAMDRFQHPHALVSDVDLENIAHQRAKDVCFRESLQNVSELASTGLPSKSAPLKMHWVHVEGEASRLQVLEQLHRPLQPYPFLAEIDDYEKVIQIQAHGLLRRAKASKVKSLIVGVSGGLDSTLALYVALRTKALSGAQLKVIAVTLPGPGTSEKTYQLTKDLVSEAGGTELGVDQLIEVPIREAVAQHMKDLNASHDQKSVVFENAQARERTQILFDLANQHQGLVVGTGDLSELALGWCTYNADHMAHYTVNSGIPKTVVKGLVGYWADLAQTRNLRSILIKILELPISPELLPPNEQGEMVQETEAVIGSYALHDFFLYHLLYSGFSKEKIHALATEAFKNETERSAPFSQEEIDFACETFFKRFYSQQFKRTTLPPGPKVHAVSLSPRADLRLPDELG